MSSVAATNRASDMWTNSAELYSHSARQANHNHGYQYPTMPHGYHQYQNNFYPQTADFGHLQGSETKSFQSPNSVVKTEPVNWHNYPNEYGSQVNLEMINKWREMNYYAQQNDNYSFEQRALASAAYESKGEEIRSVNSPGQCSVSEASYGSPHSASSAIKLPNLDEDDSPNLRALLTKTHDKKIQPFYGKYEKLYPHEATQRYRSADVNAWKKTETVDMDRNLSQFHGEFQNGVEDQTKIKGKDAVGVAPFAKESQSSLGNEESCQDMTRVNAGGDNPDYVENKMAAAPEVQAFYPWMKSAAGNFPFFN